MLFYFLLGRCIPFRELFKTGLSAAVTIGTACTRDCLLHACMTACVHDFESRKKFSPSMLCDPSPFITASSTSVKLPQKPVNLAQPGIGAHRHRLVFSIAVYAFSNLSTNFHKTYSNICHVYFFRSERIAFCHAKIELWFFFFHSTLRPVGTSPVGIWNKLILFGSLHSYAQIHAFKRNNPNNSM